MRTRFWKGLFVASAFAFLWGCGDTGGWTGGGTAPPAPTGLSATPGSGSNALSWTASPGAASYVVYWSNSGDPSSGSSVRNVSGTTFQHSGLTNGRLYRYVVAAVGLGGESGPSNVVSARPHVPNGAAISEVSLVDGGNPMGVLFAPFVVRFAGRVNPSTVNEDSVVLLERVGASETRLETLPFVLSFDDVLQADVLQVTPKFALPRNMTPPSSAFVIRVLGRAEGPAAVLFQDNTLLGEDYEREYATGSRGRVYSTAGTSPDAQGIMMYASGYVSPYPAGSPPSVAYVDAVSGPGLDNGVRFGFQTPYAPPDQGIKAIVSFDASRVQAASVSSASVSMQGVVQETPDGTLPVVALAEVVLRSMASVPGLGGFDASWYSAPAGVPRPGLWNGVARVMTWEGLGPEVSAALARDPSSAVVFRLSVSSSGDPARFFKSYLDLPPALEITFSD